MHGGVAEVHITRDRQTCAGFCQACGIQAKLLKQRLRVVPQGLQTVAQAMDKTDGEVAKANADGIHGLFGNSSGASGAGRDAQATSLTKLIGLAGARLEAVLLRLGGLGVCCQAPLFDLIINL